MTLGISQQTHTSKEVDFTQKNWWMLWIKLPMKGMITVPNFQEFYLPK
uniref:Uncharacterized protein n=1 Tax=Rhizophora mucronata TaxID=61149 RepID=A0A2P2P5C4_RHIMU